MSGYGDKSQSQTDTPARAGRASDDHRRRSRRSWLIMKSLTPEYSSEVEERWNRSARLGLVLIAGGLFWLAVGFGVWRLTH
jgi:hypothetical protein